MFAEGCIWHKATSTQELAMFHATFGWMSIEDGKNRFRAQRYSIGRLMEIRDEQLMLQGDI